MNEISEKSLFLVEFIKQANKHFPEIVPILKLELEREQSEIRQKNIILRKKKIIGR